MENLVFLYKSLLDRTISMKHHFLSASLLISAVILNSCGNGSTTSTGADTTLVDTNGTLIVGNAFDPGVPSPSEIFAFMKASGASNANAENLNSPDNEKKYDSKKAQSLNLGIYSSDLLYCATFNISNKVVSYFGTCMRMGDKLKVATNLSDKDKDRISKNAGNGDSLVAISNDLYLSTFENLESNQRGADLTLMLAGGWIESVYLMSNMVKDFEKDKNTAERIVDQKLALENLIEFSAKHAENADVKGVSSQLSELLAIMNEVQSTENVAVKAPQNTGKIIIGGGAKSTLSKEQFEKIKTKVISIRSSFTNAQ